MFDYPKKINLANSLRFMDGTARPNPYTYLSQGFVGPQPRQRGGSTFSDWWGKLKGNTADWASNPANLFKLGAGALGAYTSYRSAKDYNKLAERMRQDQQAEIAQRRAERARYDSPANYINEREQVETPMEGGRGEAEYFRNLRLPTLRMAEGGYYAGGTKGQDDKIPAMLSDGEYVIDAETVAMLGDGNNAAGASALELMRENIRRHKRAAPADKIPPKAKKPGQYMKGKK